MARAQAEEQAARDRAERADAGRGQADQRTADALAQAREMTERAEAASLDAAAATADAADVRRRAEVAEQRAGDADQLRSRAR